MASISKMSGSNKYTVRFTDIDGNRKKMALATADKKTAETVRNMVERILEQQKTGEPNRLLANWLKDIPDDTRRRLENAGLLEVKTRYTIQDLFEAYLQFNTEARKSTITNIRQAVNNAIAFWGADKTIDTITEEQAQSFRDWLPLQPFEGRLASKKKYPAISKALQQAKAERRETVYGRSGIKGTLSPATVSGRIGKMKTLFNYARRRNWIEKSPFEFIKKGEMVNHNREAYISRGAVQKMIEVAPGAKWRAIIALSRYVGLRIPSELKTLKWGDIVWSDSSHETALIKITDTKRSGHEGLGTRISPLWKEAEKELRTLFDESPEGQEYIFPGIKSSSNLRTTMEKIILRAGLQLYPRIFHSLRASCETDYHRELVPPTTYCRWIGNSPKIAEKHYIRYDETDMEAGINLVLTSRKAEPVKHGESENVSGTNTLEVLENTLAGANETGFFPGTISGTISGTQAVEINCKEKQKELNEPRKQGILQKKSPACNSLQTGLIPQVGVETDGTNHLYDNGLHEMENTVRAQFRAQSPKLQKLVSLFDSLSSEDKELFITTITDKYIL